MKNLTANQAITLLQIYRGTLSDELRVGTFEDDLHHLHSQGFIRHTRPGEYETTWGGKQLVKHMLTLP